MSADRANFAIKSTIRRRDPVVVIQERATAADFRRSERLKAREGREGASRTLGEQQTVRSVGTASGNEVRQPTDVPVAAVAAGGQGVGLARHDAKL